MTRYYNMYRVLCCVLLFLSVIASSSSGHYRSLWKSFIPPKRIPPGVVGFTSTRESAIANLRSGGSQLYVDVGLPPSHHNMSWANDTSIATIPFGVMPVAIAFHGANTSQLVLTISDIGDLLIGASTLPLRPVLIRDHNDPLLDAIVVAGAASGVPLFSSALRSIIEANAQVIWVNTEEEAVSTVVTTLNTFTLTSFPAATASSLPVASVKVFDQRAMEHITAPVVTSAQTASVDTVSGAAEIEAMPGTPPPYPFEVPAVLMVGGKATCESLSTNDETHWMSMLGTLLEIDLSSWGLAHIAPFTVNNLVGAAISEGRVCSASNIVHSKGSSAIQDLVTGLSELRLNSELTNQNQASTRLFDSAASFLTYSGGGSGGGLKAIKANNEYTVVGSDSLFSEDEYLAYPTTQFIPFTSFAVSVVYNIPGVARLVLPRCVVVGIFSGTITHWDHPQIRRYNAFANLPNKLINVWARETRSGTTGIFTAGLNALDYTCTGGKPTIQPSKTWSMMFANLILASSTSKVVKGVANTPYSIGYAGSNSVKAFGLPEAVLLDESTNKFTSPTKKFLQQAIQDATLDPQRLVLKFDEETAASAYPFAGVSYVVYNSDRQGHCAAAKQGLDFVLWSLTSLEASEWASTHSFAPIPTTVVEKAVEVIMKSKCDDALLMVASTEEQDTTTVVIVASVIPCVILIIALLLAQRALFTDHGKNNANAPIGEKECVIIFTDIESSTALWARGPSAMGPSIDLHNAIIRQRIAANNCYEVKVIGDAFMIACKTVEQGTQLALEIQQALFDANWDEDINFIYEELHEERGWAQIRKPGAPANERLWNGLRVRIGLACGPCSAKLDDVSGGYDYFGSTVNMASRIEAAGHGGQILLHESATQKLSKGFLESHQAKATPLGKVELKGFDDHVALVQLTAGQFTSRHFADLRVDANGHGNEDAAAESISAENQQSDGNDSDPSSTSSPRGGGANPTVDVGPDFIAALVQPLKDSEKRELVEKLCRAWRIPHKKASNVDMLEKLSRRAMAMVREAQRSLSRSCVSSQSGSRRRSISADDKSRKYSV